MRLLGMYVYVIDKCLKKFCLNFAGILSDYEWGQKKSLNRGISS